MPDGLYERDGLAWAERQAGLLRRLAAGERVNEQIDWPNVIEEVQDVGLRELRACESLLLQALMHLMKLAAWPTSQSARHWDEEADTFLSDAKRAFSPSMRQRIDVADLYREARRRVSRNREAPGAVDALPHACPFSLDALFEADVAALVGLLASDPPDGQAAPDRKGG